MSTLPPLEAGETHDQLNLMLAGKPYLGNDPYLSRARDANAELCADISDIRSMGKRMEAYRKVLSIPTEAKNVYIARPFLFEYGFNCIFGDNICLGPNCTFLDVCPIRIGDRTMFGANCSLYTPAHPLSPEARNGLEGPEWAVPITVGSDCWIGGSVVIVSGVTIGDGCVVGAGSVVTKDVPSRTVVVGNPARPIKSILPDGSTVPYQATSAA